MDPKTTEVSLSFLIQLYAPLAGLLVVTFWLGVLSQRMKVSERRQDKVEAQLEAAKIETVQVAVLNAQMTDMKSLLSKMERELHGVQRSIANIASGQAGTLVRLDPTGGEPN